MEWNRKANERGQKRKTNGEDKKKLATTHSTQAPLLRFTNEGEC